MESKTPIEKAIAFVDKFANAEGLDAVRAISLIEIKLLDLQEEDSTLIAEHRLMKDYIKSVIESREKLTDYPTWADEISDAGDSILENITL